ncbi:transposase [Streptomyces sp. NPDC056660]|uniref:transposase n=1 Tax=Streptomyces sp. NPDC056660 TaxID=3345897 RepID=UPI0036CA86F2
MVRYVVGYVVDNGVKWANLPRDFPPYRRVHAFGRRWQVTGLLAPYRHRDKVREWEGCSPDPMAAIVDSQSVRAAAIIPRPTSGWDGGKCAPLLLDLGAGQENEAARRVTTPPDGT